MSGQFETPAQQKSAARQKRIADGLAMSVEQAQAEQAAWDLANPVVPRSPLVAAHGDALSAR